MRTHTCGELRKKDDGKKVVLAGWVESIRLSGKIAFLDLRDRYGITQVFIGPKLSKDAAALTKESVVQVKGLVKVRPNANKEIETGAVEVSATEVIILNKAEALPLQFEEDIHSSDETRLKYRYLDLRRKEMQKNISIRHKASQSARKFLNEKGFLEIETPYMLKSTPEGARDYLVPSRVQKGKFYSLPQSPQLLKQLLMVAGFDKYYQLSRCFRDEDLRRDRQPEFTQIDMEMSFVEEEDVIKVVEELVKKIWKDVLGEEIKGKFPRISYSDAMKKYKTDRPDIRKGKKGWGFIWVTDFPLFEKDNEGRIQAIHHPFTAPADSDVGKLEKSSVKVKAKAYDLVLNGEEIGGGSIRNHKLEIQSKIFEILKLKDKEVTEKFGFLMDALKYGAPPHGGFAFGFDRLCMLLCGEDSIRDVIAFPKTKEAEDLMTGSPAKVDKKQLDELGISVKKN